MKRLFVRTWWLLTGRAKRSCGECACWQFKAVEKGTQRRVGICHARSLQRLDAGGDTTKPRSGQSPAREGDWCFHDFVPR